MFAACSAVEWTGELTLSVGGQTPCSSALLLWSFNGLTAGSCVTGPELFGFVIQTINSTTLTGGWCANRCSGAGCDSLGFRSVFLGTALAVDACTVAPGNPAISMQASWRPSFLFSGSVTLFSGSSSTPCTEPIATYPFQNMDPAGGCIDGRAGSFTIQVGA